MGLKMIRQPSETPNVSNIDDIIPFRYAYGNQNGYIIGRGLELEPSINGSTFTVQQGRVVLQGVETEIDSNGISFEIENTTQPKYFSVYYYVALGQNITDIRIRSDVSDYPALQFTDDLTNNPSGFSELELYRFIARNGVISDVQKVVKPIEYSGSALVGYDITKGTVEERLTELGFKEGVVEYSYDGEAVNTHGGTLMKQGKYVLFHYNIAHSEKNTPVKLIIPEEFRPREDLKILFCCFVDLGSLGNLPSWGEVTISADSGEIIFDTEATNIIIKTGWSIDGSFEGNLNDSPEDNPGQGDKPPVTDPDDEELQP